MSGRKAVSAVAAVSVVLLLTLSSASPAWGASYKVLYKFRGKGDGQYPDAPLIFDAAGNLYGTTGPDDSRSNGTVFKLTPQPDGSWTEQVLYTFTDENFPFSRLAFDSAGNLYGTTYDCSGNTFGTVFQLTPNPGRAWTKTTLHTFDGSDGAWPWGDLIFDAAGNLYGTASDTAFEMTPQHDGTWAFTVIHTFKGPRYGDGDSSLAGMIFDTSGNLYGTTAAGGTGNCDGLGCGTVFELTPNPDGSWGESILFSFSRVQEFPYPTSAVTFDAHGNLYGALGSLSTKYKIYRLRHHPDGSWTKRTIKVLKGTPNILTRNGVIIDAAGNLYGVTTMGGRYDSGTVFKLVPQPQGSWELITLHIFKNHNYPVATLLMDSSGTLYGTTTQGGNGYGLVFEITP